MSDSKKNRNKRLLLRLTEQECKKLNQGFSSSTKRNLSDYARDLLFNRPITVYTRDKSLDIGIESLDALKKELSAIGNNFNQAVKRLHTAGSDPGLSEAAREAQKHYSMFIEKTNIIHAQINKIFRQWLQE